jgi:phenylalanyl-tRNA synthetase beta chain
MRRPCRRPRLLSLPLRAPPGTDAAAADAKTGGYSWAPSAHPSFFPGRQATVAVGGQEVGVFGVVHPEVLAAFDVVNPVSALELNLEPLCFDQRGKSLLRRVDEGCS